MRLKSPFKDYYDGLLRMDQDSEPLFLRHTKVDEETWPLPHCKVNFSYCYKLNVKVTTIGFCGKIYPTIKMADGQPWVHSIEAVDKYIQENFSRGEVEEYYTRSKNRRANWCWCHSRARFLQLFNEYEESKTKWGGLFDKILTPTFLVREKTPAEFARNPDYRRPTILVKNPRLEDFNFAKIIPPYQAFQEIRMWLSNVAWPNKPIPTVSNDDLIVAKGFDIKTSFRKQKG